MTPWEVFKYMIACGVGIAFILGALLFVPSVVQRMTEVCQ